MPIIIPQITSDGKCTYKYNLEKAIKIASMVDISLIVFDFEKNNITVSMQNEIAECPDGKDGSCGFKTNNFIPSTSSKGLVLPTAGFNIKFTIIVLTIRHKTISFAIFLYSFVVRKIKINNIQKIPILPRAVTVVIILSIKGLFKPCIKFKIEISIFVIKFIFSPLYLLNNFIIKKENKKDCHCSLFILLLYLQFFLSFHHIF